MQLLPNFVVKVRQHFTSFVIHTTRVPKVTKDLVGPREKLGCQVRMDPPDLPVAQGSLEMLDPRDSGEPLDCLEITESR